MLDSINQRLAEVPAQTTGRILLAAVTIGLALLFGKLALSAYHSLSATPQTQPHINRQAGHVQTDYQANDIVGKNLFGRPPQGQEQLSISNLPMTQLAVILRGVFTSTDPKQASAIVELPDGSTRSYSVDAVVYGQTHLHAVFSDRIVLETSGVLETLRFPTPEQQQQLVSQQPTADEIKSLVQQTMSAEEIRDAAKQLSSASMTIEQRQQLIRERLLELRKRARENKNK